MDKDNKENKNEFEPVEPLDITRRKSPDPSAEASAPAGEPQPAPSGDAEPSGGAEPAADESAPAVPAPSDGEGAPAPSAKPPEKKGKKEKKEKQEKSAEEKAAARKRRLTLSGRIARSSAVMLSGRFASLPPRMGSMTQMGMLYRFSSSHFSFACCSVQSR